MRRNSKDGAVNETMILNSLNRHHYKDLSDNWKKHMKRMFKDIKDDDYILVNYFKFKDAKPDLEIIVNNRKVLLSVKSGHAPTMHYEPVYTFYQFLRDFNVPERIMKIISFYHYGYSRTKRVSDHILSQKEIVEAYPSYIKEVNDYFAKHDEIINELIYRAIIRGRMKEDLIDYLYYGNAARGFLLSISDIKKLVNLENNTLQTMCFKQLTYVSCARKADNPRQHHVKINWPILCKYFYDEEFMKKYG